MNNNDELSQPIAYTDREELESMQGPDGDTYAALWAIPHGCGQDIALYSHGYVSALIQRAEAAEQRLELVREQRDNELRTNSELERRLQQPALADVMTERQRQINAEGWTSDHDDEHENNEMAFAAACYALYAGNPYPGQGYTPPEWPWDAEFWRPSTERRDLVKAGALILAEIERLDRAAAKVEGE
ncbi:hypothetical protein ACMV5I_02275 [Serratia sp. T13T92]|uniref:hypothetical protein n=1 Tax=Serratia sp. T13T92 TaxID=3397496 RepID=UPI0039E16EA3